MKQKNQFFEALNPFRTPQTASGQRKQYSRKNQYHYQNQNERPHYYGHRERLRDRFIKAGKESCADYELVELLIFRAIPRGDVKPLAKRILEKFDDDISKALSAPPKELMEIEGVTPAIAGEFKIVEAVAHRLAQSRVIGKNAISSWDELMHYCKAVMAHRDLEQFRILFLDRKNFLIADESQAQGTVDHVPVYPREVVKRALEHNASALILLHNHPSGDPSPSREDIEITKQIISACDALGVEVYDHVVIGRAEDFSFRANDLI